MTQHGLAKGGFDTYKHSIRAMMREDDKVGNRHPKGRAAQQQTHIFHVSSPFKSYWMHEVLQAWPENQFYSKRNRMCHINPIAYDEGSFHCKMPSINKNKILYMTNSERMTLWAVSKRNLSNMGK